MEKRFFSLALCAMLVLSLFAGCAARPDAQSDVPEQSNEAERAYMDFLSGVGSVTTAEKFGEDDEYNYDGLLYGSYTYSELKSAISELCMSDVVTKYAFLDFGSDGTNELLLQFEPVDDTLLSWVGTIRYDGGELRLNDHYEHGYRTEAELFSSGYLKLGGSFGAGAHGYSLLRFDESGVLSPILTESELHGDFAYCIVYDLREDGGALTDEFSANALLDRSELLVREYFADGAVKLCAYDLSSDPTIREGEEAFLGELEALGAELISDAEMDALCSLEPYSAPEVEWLDWDGGGIS